jgi:hypothetical protein
MLEPLEVVAVLLFLAGLGALWFRLEQLEDRVRRTDERIRRLLRDSKTAAAAHTPLERRTAPAADVDPMPASQAPPRPVLSENVFLSDTEPDPSPVRESLQAFVNHASEPTTKDAPKTPEREIDWEELLAGRWLAWIGGLAVVIGAGFGFKYAIEHQWIGPEVRVLIGLVVGIACLIGGTLAARRDYRYFAQGLVGAGLGVLYLSLYAAHLWYGLISYPAAFGGMVLTTAAGLIFAGRFDAQPTAVLGLLGGFLTPYMLQTGANPFWTMFPYLALLDFSVVVLAAWRRWRSLQSCAFAATLLAWMGWFGTEYTADQLGSTLAMLSLFFALFAGMGVLHALIWGRPLYPEDLVLVILSPLAYFAAVYALTFDEYRHWQGLMAVGMSALYLAAAGSARWRSASPLLTVSLLAISISFIVLAVPLYFEGAWITIAWIVEGAALVEIAFYTGERRLRMAGSALLIVAQLILFVYGVLTLAAPAQFHPPLGTDSWLGDVLGLSGHDAAEAVAHVPSWRDLINGRSMAYFADAIALGLLAWESYRRRGREESAPSDQQFGDAVLVGAPLALLLGILLEQVVWGAVRHWLPTTILCAVAVWTACGALAVLVGSNRGRNPLNGLAWFAFGLLALLLVVDGIDTVGPALDAVHNPELLQRLQPPERWFANPRGAAFLVGIAAAIAAMVLRWRADEESALGSPWRGRSAASIFGLGTLVAGFCLLTTEFYAQGVVRGWGTGASLAVTLVWIGYGDRLPFATLATGLTDPADRDDLQGLSVRPLAVGNGDPDFRLHRAGRGAPAGLIPLPPISRPHSRLGPGGGRTAEAASSRCALKPRTSSASQRKAAGRSRESTGCGALIEQAGRLTAGVEPRTPAVPDRGSIAESAAHRGCSDSS